MKLTQAEYDALSDDNKKLFKKDGDTWVSVTAAKTEEDDDGDTAGLKSALAKERAEVKRLKDEQKTKEKEAQDKADEAARKSGSVDALEKSWQKKYDDLAAEKDGTIKAREASLHKLLAETEAERLATKISTMPKLMKDQILKRVKVEYDENGEPKTRVLDNKGEISAATLEDLEKEILADKEYAGILVGSRASGGGAARGSSEAGSFKMDDYKNSDGSVNWTKVNNDRTTNPDIVKQVTESLNPTITAGQTDA